MNAPQLPAHLQGRQSTGMAARASEGLGSTLPPHISIQGNKFTFIDSAGGESQPMLIFDGYIVDVGDHTHKRYYDKLWDPNQNTYEPPACWSSNGIGPSREASKPQAMTCESCPQNVRGSAFSKMSGAAIKACRDEKWIGIVFPQFGEVVWQLVITPGSFKNWKNFTNSLDHHKIEPYWVLTRFAFEDKVNGVLNFSIAPAGPQGGVSYTPPEHLAVLDKIIASKASDAVVGRLDQPRSAALPNYSQGQQGTAAQLPPNQFAPQGTGQQMQASPQAMVNHGFQQPQGHQEVIPPEQAPFGAPNAGFQSTSQGAPTMQPTNAVPGTANAAGGFPSNPPPAAQPQPTQRRRRNAAAQAPAAQNGAGGAPQGFQPGPAPQAPFGNAQLAAGQPAATGFSQSPSPSGSSTFNSNTANPAGGATNASPSNNFGISEGAPVNPEMSNMLAGLFGQGQKAG